MLEGVDITETGLPF